MSITDISSISAPYQPNYQTGFRQRWQDFKALDGALQSGDLSKAQDAFAQFQKDLQNGPRSANKNQYGQLGKDLQALQSALESGDVAKAQQAFATLKQDLQTAHHAGHSHHHRRPDNDGDADDSVQVSSGVQSSSGTSTLIQSSFNQQA